ncbi:ubiquinone/menaquinone biosynthesis methyltransferase [Vulgatibacter sp.]|uniref:ubiquinone/menaquinone biosynthesis methyltransferase n=1 Tax=Vulgatibacter sp. TaxID=1971226 RepID=UPI003567D533
MNAAPTRHGPQAQGHDGSSVRSMFDRIAPTYDTLNHLLSAGVDNFWRTIVARELPDPSARVLDLCAGTLDLGVAVQKEHPGAQVICADFAVEMLRRGQHKLPTAGLTGADAMNLPFKDESFDAAVCGFGVRNVSDLAGCFREVRRCLKPGGVFVVLEFFRPERAVTKFFHNVYNRQVLPTVGAAISGDKGAYQYLADSMERFFSLAEAQELLRENGYTDVRGYDLFFGVASVLRGTRS